MSTVQPHSTAAPAEFRPQRISNADPVVLDDRLAVREVLA